MENVPRAKEESDNSDDQVFKKQPIWFCPPHIKPNNGKPKGVTPRTCCKQVLLYDNPNEARLGALRKNYLNQQEKWFKNSVELQKKHFIVCQILTQESFLSHNPDALPVSLLPREVTAGHVRAARFNVLRMSYTGGKHLPIHQRMNKQALQTRYNDKDVEMGQFLKGGGGKGEFWKGDRLKQYYKLKHELHTKCMNRCNTCDFDYWGKDGINKHQSNEKLTRSKSDLHSNKQSVQPNENLLINFMENLAVVNRRKKFPPKSSHPNENLTRTSPFISSDDFKSKEQYNAAKNAFEKWKNLISNKSTDNQDLKGSKSVNFIKTEDNRCVEDMRFIQLERSLSMNYSDNEGSVISNQAVVKNHRKSMTL